MFCSKCPTMGCTKKDSSKMPLKMCPTRDEELQKRAHDLYVGADMEMEHHSTMVETEGNCNWTRVEEMVVFFRKMGYKRIGLAFCMGLHDEAGTLTQIFEKSGFKVISIGCKNGATLKTWVGVPVPEKETYVKNDIMCNPIGQALYLNDQNVDITVLFGLCVGHDTLFLKHIKTLVTIFAVKDRVLCHNPVGVLYQTNAYYRKKLARLEAGEGLLDGKNDVIPKEQND